MNVNMLWVKTEQGKKLVENLIIHEKEMEMSFLNMLRPPQI